MKTMILTGRFGMGHVKAAEAIKQQLLEDDPKNEVEIVDFIEYMFPKLRGGIYGVFNFLVSKCSGLYNLLNQVAGKTTAVPLKHTVTKKIDRLITDYGVDRIIVTFPVCSQYISTYKQMCNCSIPLYTYITDITAHEEWIAPGTDQYFVGDLTTKNTLLSKGVEEERITVSGIPVKKEFFVEDMKYTVDKKKEILVMGGGLGLIPSSDGFLHALASRNDLHVTIISGKNQKLKDTLMEKFAQMEIVGFTNEVYRYMKRADLVITKAGGVTTFEAVASNTPLYVIKPFLEQEYGNAKYIEEHNIGRVLWDDSVDEGKDVLNLIDNTKLLMDMQKNMMQLKAQFEVGGMGKCS